MFWTILLYDVAGAEQAQRQLPVTHGLAVAAQLVQGRRSNCRALA
ncbi:MAG TPA: hypothetical protein VGY58_02840 [Gemmataceae bacterium]|nr:hypothetical protein [Gemmataceae bacterium]